MNYGVVKNTVRVLFLVLCFVSVALVNLISLVQAEDYTSPNFILRDPVITIEGGRATSPSFEYYSSGGQLITGESTSSSFIQRAGFLYYPVATSPIITATPGNGQVVLTWTRSVGVLANITNYQVGTGTVSGGPYTFESVGNVLTFTKTGLTNGTPYFFKIKADADTLTLVQSAEVSATPVAPTAACGDGSCNGSETCSTCPSDCGSCPSGGGGGGGGYIAPPVITQVIFTGRAYPKSTVTLLKDAQISATTIAGTDANFQLSISGLSGGNYIFSVYGEDSKGIRSSLLTFPVSITSGATTKVSGIFISPTIAVDKSEVKRGDNIAIFGQSIPSSEVTISVNSEEEFFNKIKADVSGAYLYNFDTAVLEIGQHFTKSKAALNGEISSFSKAIGFAVGTKNVLAQLPTKAPAKGDLNSDNRVNLVDFSITAYWYKRPSPPSSVDLNSDGKVDLVDFSITAYYWTG